MGRAGAEMAGVATCCCCMASLWDRLCSFLAWRYRLLFLILRLCRSVIVAICWLLGSVQQSEFSTPLPVLFALSELMCARKADMAVVTTAWTVAASLGKVGFSLFGGLSLGDDMSL